VTGQRRHVRHDDVVADHAVVRHMTVGHEQASVADDGGSGGFRAAVDGDAFADDGLRSDLDVGLFPLVFQILRRRPHEGAGVDVGFFPDDGVLDDGVRPDDGFLAEGDVLSDHGVRSDLHLRPEVGGGMDDGRGMDQ